MKGIVRICRRFFLLLLRVFQKRSSIDRIENQEVAALDAPGQKLESMIRLTLFVDGTLTIKGKHSFADVSWLEKNKGRIRRIHVDEGIDRLPSFIDYPILEEIVLPSSLHELSENACKGCISLKNINLEHIEQIGPGAFRNCLSLQNVRFPLSTCRIMHEAFENCVSLPQVYIPCLWELSYDAFKGCTRLRRIKIVGDMNLYCPTIYAGAFSNCTSLEQVYLDNIGCIDRVSFQNCISLNMVKFHQMSPAIYPDAFKGCDSLCAICFPDDFTYIKDTDIGLGRKQDGSIMPGFIMKGNMDSNAQAYADTMNMHFELWSDESGKS